MSRRAGEYWFGEAPYIGGMEARRKAAQKRRNAALKAARTRKHNLGDHSTCTKTCPDSPKAAK